MVTMKSVGCFHIKSAVSLNKPVKVSILSNYINLILNINICTQ